MIKDLNLKIEKSPQLSRRPYERETEEGPPFLFLGYHDL